MRKKITTLLFSILFFSTTFAQWQNVGMSTLETNSVTKINQIFGHDGKLYVATDNGLWYSANGDGSDWVQHVGNEKNITYYLFSKSGSEWALVDGVLSKKNGSNLETVNYVIDGIYDLDADLKVGEIFEAVDPSGPTYYILVSGWATAAGYGGVWRTSDDGATWDHYNTISNNEDVTTELNDNKGLYDNGRIIVTNYVQSPTTNWIFTMTKNRIQYSPDFGVTWHWRYGNLNVPGWATSQDLVIKNYQGKEYLFYGVQDMSYVFRTEIKGDGSAGLEWDVAEGNKLMGKRPNLASYKDELLLGSARGKDIMMKKTVAKTENNGNTWENFTTGLDTATVYDRLEIIGDYAYMDVYNSLSLVRYDLAATPNWLADVPKMENIKTYSADLIVGFDLPGDYYYVVLEKGATQPTAEQIMAGTDASDNPANFKGNKFVVNDDTDTITIKNLLANTEYIVFGLLKSENVNFSSIKSVEFKTLIPYDVTFNVKNTENKPIENAGINFNSQNKVTNAAGTVTFTGVGVNDDISYTVSGSGYITENSTVSVINKNETVNVILDTLVYDMTFKVLNPTDIPLENATVNFNGEEKTTNAEGFATFMDVGVQNNMPYTINLDGYFQKEATTSVVNKDDTTTVKMDSLVFDVTFNITNMITEEAIENISVNFNGEDKMSNASGVVVFNAVGVQDDLGYTVSGSGYKEAGSTVSIVDKDTTVKVALIELVDVLFKVKKSADEAIEGATVTFNSVDKTTDTNGEVIFNDIEAGSEFAYSIAATEYTSQNGNLLVEKDTTLTVTLWILSIEQQLNLSNVQTYPNPNNGNFMMKIKNPATEKLTISVMNNLGQIVYQNNVTVFKHNEYIENFNLKVPQGMYILNVKGKHTDFNQKVIIK